VLGRLTRDGLADVPPFAMVVDAPDRRRVIVRGGFRVVAGGEDITASGVSTWVERVIGTDVPYELVAPFTATSEPAEAWPIVEGMVPASIVRSAASVIVEPAAVTAESPAVPEETPAAPEETMAPPEDHGSELVDDTIVDDTIDDETIIVDRPAPPARSTTQAPAPDQAPTGDHDGLTIAVTALQQLRRSAKPKRRPEPSAQPEAAAPPPAVSVRLPGGAAETLTGEIVLGRSPSVSRASGTKLPRLVTIGTGDPDISRSHVRIGLEGGTVVVTDLHSRNGTSVVQPGRAPLKLRAGEPTPVLVGTVIDLGGGCEVTVVTD
jgi:hypothetical protein